MKLRVAEWSPAFALTVRIVITRWLIIKLGWDSDHGFFFLRAAMTIAAISEAYGLSAESVQDATRRMARR